MHGQYHPLGGLMPQYGLAPGPPSQYPNDQYFQSQQGSIIQASGNSGYPPQSLAPGAPITGSAGSVGSAGSIGEEGSAGSGGPMGPPAIQFQCPKRPNHGLEGRQISLRANHFKVGMPSSMIQHYGIDIQPDKCPRKVNR